MGKQEISRQLYDLVNTPNDRAFSLVTIFVMSLFIASAGTALFTTLTAFIALTLLVVSTILSSLSPVKDGMRKLGAFLCVFLWLFTAQMSGALQSNNMIWTACYYTLLFWSNINLLGVLLNGSK